MKNLNFRVWNSREYTPFSLLKVFILRQRLFIHDQTFFVPNNENKNDFDQYSEVVYIPGECQYR